MTSNQRNAGLREATAGDELVVAPLWRRAVARGVDMIAVAVWLFAFSVSHVFLHIQLWSDTVSPEPWRSAFLTTVTFVVMLAAYEIVFVTKTGATPGKDLMRIKVVRGSDGSLPTLAQALVRSAPFGLVNLIPWLWVTFAASAGLGFSALADPTQLRSLHDRLAGTRVVRSSPPDGVDEDEDEEQRRSHYLPRFLGPLEAQRLARDEPEKLLRPRRSETS